MEAIGFYCVNCGAEREIGINAIEGLYIIGKCQTCNIKVVINRKKLKKERIYILKEE